MKYSIGDPFSTLWQKIDSSSMVGTSVHSSAIKLKNGAPRSWSSTIHQPKLHLTTVTSETCASNTSGMKILCAFQQLTCVPLQPAVLESIFAL